MGRMTLQSLTERFYSHTRGDIWPITLRMPTETFQDYLRVVEKFYLDKGDLTSDRLIFHGARVKHDVMLPEHIYIRFQMSNDWPPEDDPRVTAEPRIDQDVNSRKDLCALCGKSAMHWDPPQCCRCYVLAGNPPADWHTVCMVTYAEMKKGS